MTKFKVFLEQGYIQPTLHKQMSLTHLYCICLAHHPRHHCHHDLLKHQVPLLQHGALSTDLPPKVKEACTIIFMRQVSVQHL